MDLVLLHAPGEPGPRAEAWRALEDSVPSLTKSIGVSNFGAAHLDKLLASCRIRPAVNQVEIHPWLQRRELVEYCRAQGIVVEAYSPLAKAQKLSTPEVMRVAEEAHATPAQVLVAWSLHKGLVTLPKSVHRERQEANLKAGELVLSEDHVKRLDALEEGLVTGWDPISEHPV